MSLLDIGKRFQQAAGKNPFIQSLQSGLRQAELARISTKRQIYPKGAKANVKANLQGIGQIAKVQPRNWWNQAALNRSALKYRQMQEPTFSGKVGAGVADISGLPQKYVMGTKPSQLSAPERQQLGRFALDYGGMTSAMQLVGTGAAKKFTSKAVKANEQNIRRAIGWLKNWDKISTAKAAPRHLAIQKIAKENIPEVINTPRMRRWATTDQTQWMKVVRRSLEDKVARAGEKGFRVGLGVQELKSVPDAPTDPVEKIINALGGAKPLRTRQEALYRKARAQKYAKMMGARGRVGGEKGFFAEKGALKGELPKVQFETLRDSLKQSDIDTLFDRINKSNIGDWEKINAKTGLAKILGHEGGAVPTKSELSLLDEVYGREFTSAVLDKRETLQKVIDVLGDAVNVPRSLMASFDLSAPFRQGLFFVGRPKQWGPAFKGMVKSFGSEKAYNGMMDDIAGRPTYKLMRDYKLALTKPNSKLAEGEEQFMSNMAEQIPGIGRVVKASDRAYTGFLNKLRADVFDDLLKKGSDLGLGNDPKFLNDMAGFVNNATGRGNMPSSFNQASQLLSGTLFSPRLIASRLNLLNPVYYARLQPQVRKEALKSLFTLAGAGMTVLGLSKLGGATVVTDPRNSDFGKVKFGNTRYDIWGGFQQYIKLAAQLTSGKLISSTTGKEFTLGEGYKPITRLSILGRFAEGKTAPVVSFALGMLRGTNIIGEDFVVSKELQNRFVPLVVQDMHDLGKERGLGGMAMSVPAIFGVGTQTYGTREEERKKAEKRGPLFKSPNIKLFGGGVEDVSAAEEIAPLPKDEERLTGLYKSALTKVNNYQNRLDQSAQGLTETKPEDIEEDLTKSVNLITRIKQQYPEKVFQVELETNSKTGNLSTSDRAKWAAEQLKNGVSIEKLYEGQVLTKSVVEALNENYGLNLTKYNYGDGFRTIGGAVKGTGSKYGSGKKITVRKPAVKAFKLKPAPKIKLGDIPTAPVIKTPRRSTIKLPKVQAYSPKADIKSKVRWL